MLLSPALSTLACAPAAAPRASVVHAGFLRDARAELRSDNHLAFEATLQWPATASRRSFVVEGLGADGALLFSRPVTAHAPAPRAPRLRCVHASFELELPALEGVAELRVRLAR